MKAYKGFNKDMTCKGFQYEEGKTYTTDDAKLCESGFHACESPLDCFRYYAPGQSVYHEVELDDVSVERGDDTKRCGKRIKIGGALDVAGLVKAHFEYVKSHTTNEQQGADNANLTARDRSSLAAQDGSSLAAGENSLLAAFNSKAKAGLGSVIAIANREVVDDEWTITDFAAGVVDGVKIKADTWYKVENGEFVEVTED